MVCDMFCFVALTFYCYCTRDEGKGLAAVKKIGEHCSANKIETKAGMK